MTLRPRFGVFASLLLLTAGPALAGPDIYGLGTGKDGALTVNATVTAEDSDYRRLRSNLAAGASVLPIEGRVTWAVGDLVMVFQAGGYQPAPSSGDQTALNLEGTDTGRWELARITGIDCVGGMCAGDGGNHNLTLDAPMQAAFSSAHTQVIRVREYTDVNIGPAGVLQPPAWNGSTGGMLAFLANGTVTNQGRIDVSGRGFRGGTVVNNSGNTGCSGLDEPAPNGQRKGEGVVTTHFGASYTGRGNIGNGGGGGVCHNSGGGGGGNATQGGLGGRTWSGDGSRDVGGLGGAALEYSLLERITFGGGGGAGDQNNNVGSRGGAGGGALWVRAHTFAGNGHVLADGESAPADPEDANDAQGGGGAGGSIYLRVSESLSCGEIRARGGDGGSLHTPDAHGPGGGGGAGRILVQAYALDSSCDLNALSGDAGVHIGSSGVPNHHGAVPPVGQGVSGTIVLPPGGFARVPDAPFITAPASGVPLADDQPDVEGTAEPLSTVRIFLDDVEVGVELADATGAWGFTFPDALDDGVYDLTATATNATGESLPSSVVVLIIDTTPPDAPAITAPQGVGNDPSPLVTGTAEANSVVQVFLDGAALGSVSADGAGAWSFPFSSPLADGDYVLTATATDAAGNTSPLSAPSAFTVDTVAPAAPVLLAPANGALVNTATPTVSGTSEPYSVVTLYVDGVAAGSATTGADGNVSIEPTSAFAEGENVLTLVATDLAGNSSGASAPSSVFVDTTPPAAPSIEEPEEGSFHQAVSLVSGLAEAGSLVELFLGGVLAGQGLAGVDGTWSIAPGPLADGTYSATARSTDAAGNPGAFSAPRTFTVDTVAPDAPVLVAPANGALVNTGTPTVSGTSEPYSVVILYVDGVAAGSATAGSDGAFVIAPTSAFAEGENVLTLTATDRAGNVSLASAPSSVLVDTVAPDAPVILAPEEGVVTSEATPTLTGTAEEGSAVLLTLYDADDAELLALSLSTDAAGQWSYTLDDSEALTTGAYRLIAVAVDVAGHESAPAERHFEVDIDDGEDTTPPDTLITSGPDDPSNLTLAHFTFTSTEPGSTFECALNDPGFLAPEPCDAGEHTYTDLDEGTWLFAVRAIDAAGNVDPTPAFFEWEIAAALPPAPVLTAPVAGLRADPEVRVEGASQPGSLVRVFVNGDEVGTVPVGADGLFALDLGALADGQYEIGATAENAFGVSPPAVPVVIVIDTDAPGAPTLEEPEDGAYLNDPLPTLSGTADAGSTVSVRVDSVVVGTTTAGVDGSWSFPLVDPLDDGEHVLDVFATDAAGNVSPPSLPAVVIVDTVAPAEPVILAPEPGTTTVETTPTITGTAEQGSTVRVEVRDEDGDVVVSVEVPTDVDGQWSYTPELGEALEDGTYTLEVVAVDAAGNESPPATGSFTVDTATGADTTPPDTILLSGPDAVTAEREATFTFTSTEPGSTFECAYGAGAFEPCVSGHTVSLLDVGDHVFRVRATDPAGNTDPTPAVHTWRVELGTPSVPVVTWPSSGDATNDPTPVVTGTADPGSTLTIYVDGAPVTSGTVGGDGSFAIELPALPGDGTYEIVVEASNGLGSAATDPIDLVLDTVPPAVPTFDEDLEDSFTNADPPTLSGSGEPGTTVVVVVDGEVVGEVEVDEDGNWSITLPDPVGEGSHEVEVHAEDPAGNVSVPSDPIVIVVDLTPPDAPVLLAPADGSVTSERRPAVQGTAEPFALVTLLLDGDLLGEVEADADGGFGFTPTFDLDEGLHDVEAYATDAAGNESDRAQTSFTVDVEAEPVVPPDTVIDSGPESPSASVDATFAFSCTKPACTFECSLDGSPFEACASPKTYTDLDEGEHTFRVRAIDEDGNVDPTPALHTWEIELPVEEGICGDGIRQANEGCDDGNRKDGDGCSADCAIEQGWDCEEEDDGASSCFSTVDPEDPPGSGYVITGGGCACDASRPSGDAALFGLLALGLFGWRRRRRG